MNEAVNEALSAQQRFRPRRWLAPLGALYLAISALRRRAIRGVDCGVPVISVGNLTAGGTGKSPLVAWLTARLQAGGRAVGIVSRGYGGRAPHEPLLVYHDGRLCSDAAQAGDEAVMHALALRPHVIVTGKDRVAAARAARAHGAEVIVLDDGFQHHRLARTIDLVLIDARDPLGGGRGLPAGLLRERPSALAAAGAVILTHAVAACFEQPLPLPASVLPPALAPYLAPGVPLIPARHEAVAVIDPHGARRPVEVLRGQRLVWIAGIADPSRFASDLAALGAVLVHGAARGDHHRFAPSELAALQARAAAAEAWLITTAKDAARWPAQLPRPAVLEIELAIGGESLLWAPIEAALASGRTATRAC